MPYIPINNANGVVVNVATTTITRDGVTENMELTTLADPQSGLQPSVNAAGDTSASNAIAIQGLLNMTPLLTKALNVGSSNANITSVTVTTSSTQLLAANTRVGFILSCIGPGEIYISYGSNNDANTNFSVTLAPGSPPFRDNLPFNGAMFAITQSGTCVVQVTELT